MLIAHRESAGMVGRAYLRIRPAESGVGLLTDLLTSEWTGDRKRLDRMDLEVLRTRLRHQMREDFKAGRVVLIQNWILSVTEARICALVSLV